MALGRTNVGGSGSKVKLDGEKVTDKLELTSYNGDNPLTIGAAGVSFPANTLFVEDFNIINGVNGEDLTAEVADQTTAVEELMKMVNRKIAMNNGEGQFVWKKYDTDTAPTVDDTFIYAVSTDSEAYPVNGVLDGCWYEMWYSPSTIIATWSGGTDRQIRAMVEAHYNGEINLYDYWTIGDERKVTLSAMNATGVGETHVEQEVTLVLMDKGIFSLTDYSGKSAAFVVGQKNSLLEGGYVNSTRTNANGWNGSARRTWCNNTYRNAFSDDIKSIFKRFSTKACSNKDSLTITTSTDYFALPAEKEVFGTNEYSVYQEANVLTQFEYYKTASNRIKKLGDNGNAFSWYERSLDSGSTQTFCRVNETGNIDWWYADENYGIAPFGCI